MGKETSERYFITSGEVKKTVNVTKATKSRLQAAAISQGAGIALSKFKVNPKTPVRYRGASRSPKVYRAGVKKDRRRKAAGRKPEVFRYCYEIRTRRRFFQNVREKPSDQTAIRPVCSADGEE